MPTTLTIERARPTWLPAAGAAGFALALAAASQVAIPLPGTPVPLTLQPMLVVLAGMMLGPRAGAASMALFLAAGATGLPVFTPGPTLGVARLFGPTGGYLLAYPAAAFVAGWASQRSASLPGRTLAAIAGMGVIYLGGLSQLAILTGSLESAVLLGLVPFAVADLVKSIVAAVLTGSRGARRSA